MTQDLEFHITRLEEIMTLINRAMKQASKGVEESRQYPELALKRLETVLTALEDAEEILSEQLDKLEE